MSRFCFNAIRKILQIEEKIVENFVEMHDDDVESDSEGEYGNDSDDEEEERDYGEEQHGDEQVDEENLFGDIDDLDDDDDAPGPNMRMSELERLKIAMAYEDIPPEELLDFESLDDEEMDLPFSYIVSPKMQWEYVLDACNSGFGVVSNLGKVSNAVLRLVADAAMMAVRDGTARVPEINDAFMRYAGQRGV
jgi:hypothetical protein